MGLFSNISAANPYGTGANWFSTTDADTDIPGYSTTPDDEKDWTLGLNEGQVYLKFNGVEVWRDEYDAISHYTAGTVMWKQPNGGQLYGHRLLSVEETAPATTYAYGTDLAARTLDVRDFGLKRISTTGSISTGSTTLTVDSLGTQFAIGDPIMLTTTKVRGDSIAVGGYLPATASPRQRIQ